MPCATDIAAAAATYNTALCNICADWSAAALAFRAAAEPAAPIVSIPSPPRCNTSCTSLAVLLAFSNAFSRAALAPLTAKITAFALAWSTPLPVKFTRSPSTCLVDSNPAAVELRIVVIIFLIVLRISCSLASRCCFAIALSEASCVRYADFRDVSTRPVFAIRARIISRRFDRSTASSAIFAAFSSNFAPDCTMFA